MFCGGGPNPLADMDRGVKSAGGSKSAVTPATLLNRAATTPGTLFDKCVGSLTSHRILDLNPYPR